MNSIATLIKSAAINVPVSASRYRGSDVLHNGTSIPGGPVLRPEGPSSRTQRTATLTTDRKVLDFISDSLTGAFGKAAMQSGGLTSRASVRVRVDRQHMGWGRADGAGQTDPSLSCSLQIQNKRGSRSSQDETSRRFLIDFGIQMEDLVPF